MNGSSAITARNTRPAPFAECLTAARHWGLFLKEAVSNPRAIGAILPSSSALAHRMAESASAERGAFVVELGAGTGAVTEALLERGIPPRRLLAVECSEPLAELLRARFPSVNIACGDAADLRQWVRCMAPRGKVVHIVSSLPLRSLPASKVRAILGAISAVLRRGGTWTQYTYALASLEVPPGFVRVRSTVVWPNIPPARVDVFESRFRPIRPSRPRSAARGD